MMLAKPIPDGVSNTDHVWQSQYIELTNALVLEGAKSSIIERFTGASHRRVKEIYRALRNMNLPTGPVSQGSPHFFAANRVSGYNWNVQCSIFVECYIRLEKLIPFEVNRGWLLLKAYQTYKARTEKLAAEKKLSRIDINQAYSLIALTGFGRKRSNADLNNALCPKCSTNYLVVASEELETQPCPICAINESRMRRNESKRGSRDTESAATAS